MDIPLEEDDSSDEEYQPDDEDEDETAEEVNATCTKISSAWSCLRVCGSRMLIILTYEIL